jgi:hypothetical protein
MGDALAAWSVRPSRAAVALCLVGGGVCVGGEREGVRGSELFARSGARRREASELASLLAVRLAFPQAPPTAAWVRNPTRPGRDRGVGRSRLQSRARGRLRGCARAGDGACPLAGGDLGTERGGKNPLALGKSEEKKKGHRRDPRAGRAASAIRRNGDVPGADGRCGRLSLVASRGRARARARNRTRCCLPSCCLPCPQQRLLLALEHHLVWVLRSGRRSV